MLEPFNPGTRPTRDDPFLKLLFAAGLASESDCLAKEVASGTEIVQRIHAQPLDSSTSRGLKKCHKSFDSVCAILDKVFAQTREESMRGSRVASDHLLFFSSTRGWDRITSLGAVLFSRLNSVALLSSPYVRESIVFTLSKISHQRDTEVLQRFTSDMLDSAEPKLDHVAFVEKTVCVLSHATTSIFLHDTPDPQVMAALPRVLRFMLSVVRLPGSTQLSFDHLVIFYQQTASRFPEPFLANPDCLDFLVACSRVRDICTRICSQRALIDVFRSPELEYEWETEPKRKETRKLLQKYYRRAEPSSSKLRKDEDKFRAIVHEFKSNPQCSHLDLGKELAALNLSCEAIVRAWVQRDVDAGGLEKLVEMFQVDSRVAELLPAFRYIVRKAAEERTGLDVTADILGHQTFDMKLYHRLPPKILRTVVLCHSQSIWPLVLYFKTINYLGTLFSIYRTTELKLNAILHYDGHHRLGWRQFFWQFFLMLYKLIQAHKLLPNRRKLASSQARSRNPQDALFIGIELASLCGKLPSPTSPQDDCQNTDGLSLMACQDHPDETVAYAQEALKRHPTVPFFYYIIAGWGCGIEDDTITRLLYAEKGLQCGADSDGMTEDIRLSLIYLTIYFSHIVLSSVAEGSSADSRMKEVHALTKMALDNANTFARIAPLDHLRRPLMAAVGTLIDLVRNGHLWSDDSFITNRKVFAHICDIARCTVGLPADRRVFSA
ncbi:hypothetical protein FB45DRAFT_1007364 [Roridomyces roridus]|uniref:Uncharacterized protein n=1 Tax=Roridomyces roridus TaxID=1738132 RepID=A0AAD7FE51_9AGAR|nr:hypothetical protein FB45DRAFT_1007364 [Roridomyces roridus]